MNRSDRYLLSCSMRRKFFRNSKIKVSLPKIIVYISLQLDFHKCIGRVSKVISIVLWWACLGLIFNSYSHFVKTNFQWKQFCWSVSKWSNYWKLFMSRVICIETWSLKLFLSVILRKHLLFSFLAWNLQRDIFVQTLVITLNI